MEESKKSDHSVDIYEKFGEEKMGSVRFNIAKKNFFLLKNNIRSQIAQWLPPQSFLMNASFCKITSDFVAFISGNQLFIDRFWFFNFVKNFFLEIFLLKMCYFQSKFRINTYPSLLGIVGL